MLVQSILNQLRNDIYDRERIVDFATVRELLSDARERRGDLSYEQIMALQHAEWAASANRGGTKTDPKVFAALYTALLENEKLSNIQKSVQR